MFPGHGVAFMNAFNLESSLGVVYYPTRFGDEKAQHLVKPACWIVGH